MITINGTQYDAICSAVDGAVTVHFPGSTPLAEVTAFGDAPTIDANGESYAPYELYSIQKDAFGKVVGKWHLATELQMKTAELNAKDAKLSAISEAITALGTGVPTLAKLKDFLNSVKEAVGYGND